MNLRRKGGPTATAQVTSDRTSHPSHPGAELRWGPRLPSRVGPAPTLLRWGGAWALGTRLQAPRGGAKMEPGHLQPTHERACEHVHKCASGDKCGCNQRCVCRCQLPPGGEPPRLSPLPGRGRQVHIRLGSKWRSPAAIQGSSLSQVSRPPSSTARNVPSPAELAVGPISVVW